MSEQELPTSTQALLAGAAVQAEHLARISEDLVKQVRMTKWERGYFVLMTLLIAALGVALVWLAISNRQNTDATKLGTEKIIDCTTAGHPCYDRNQSQTAQAVTNIVQANLASTWCSIHSKTYSGAQKCVAQLIAVPKHP